MVSSGCLPESETKFSFINSVGSRLSTKPLHRYCPADVPPFVEVIDLYLIVRLWSCVFSH